MSSTSATSASDSSDIYNEYMPDGTTTVGEYINMTDDEQDAYWANYAADLKAQGLNDEEIADRKASDQEILDGYINACEDYVDDLEDYEGTEEWIEEIDNISSELSEAEDKESNEIDTQLNLDRDYSDGSEVNIDDDSLELSETGYTYEYTMSGSSSSSNPFETDDSSDSSDSEYLIDEGITDSSGTVISDANLDGVMNYDDITYTLDKRDEDALFMEQPVYISGENHWELVSAEGDTYTFKVSDPDDPTKYCYVKLINPGVIYWGGNTITESDVATITSNWPTGLKDISQWGDTGETFTDLTTEDVELTDAERYAVIEDYTESVEGLSSSTVTQYVDNGTSQTVQDTAEEALNLLYSYLDDPTKSLSDIWSEINQLTATLSDADKSSVIQLLVANVAINCPQNFVTFFSPVYTTLVATMDYKSDTHADINENEKTAVLLLYSMIEGDTTISMCLSKDGSTEGTWKDQAENMAAINNVQAILNLGGSATSVSWSTYLANETAIQTAESNAATTSSSSSDNDSTAENIAELAIFALTGLPVDL